MSARIALFTARIRQLWLRALQPEGDLAQGLVEYAVILFLVALVVVAILTVYGSTIANMFSRVTSEVTRF